MYSCDAKLYIQLSLLQYHMTLQKYADLYSIILGAQL